jgi:hypothetical protein
MRRPVILTAALLAAVFLYLLTTLPPRPVQTSDPVAEDVRRKTVAGAFHVHSTRSDGTGDLDEIAAAASRAGLRFVVLTDHGDAARTPDAPQYRHGVLVIDAVEVSTNQGHLIALDMPPAPYPLGGDARDVVEDVTRLGGFSVAAHPDSAKLELRWSDSRPVVDGLEWLNLDSEWRDEARTQLVRAAIDYVMRPAPALATLLDRPKASLDRWDALIARRSVVAMAGHDAHGGVAEGNRRGLSGRFGAPSYEASFRTFALRAMLSAEPTGTAADDARSVVDAIRHGRVFTAVDAIASPAFMELRADAAGASGIMGHTVPFAADARITVRATMPPRGRIALLRSGQDVAESTTGELQVQANSPGAYRVEVRADGPGISSVPWMVSNPVYLREQGSVGAPAPTVFSPVVAVNMAGAAVEKDPASEASLSPVDGGFAVTFRLRPGERVSQYVAVAVPMPATVDARAIELTGRGASPMRVSVQLRFKDQGGARWIRSVYLPPEGRQVVVPFEEMTSADRIATVPRFATASSILFVVDLTNASPGQSGRFEIAGVSLAK